MINSETFIVWDTQHYDVLGLYLDFFLNGPALVFKWAKFFILFQKVVPSDLVHVPDYSRISEIMKWKYELLFYYLVSLEHFIGKLVGLFVYSKENLGKKLSEPEE